MSKIYASNGIYQSFGIYSSEGVTSSNVDGVWFAIVDEDGNYIADDADVLIRAVK